MLCLNMKNGQLLDLIYPHTRKSRVDEVKPLFLSDHCRLPQKLHRVTLFLTFQCNLRCRYCNTIRKERSPTMPGREKGYDLDLFKQVVDRLVPYNVQHLHLTGGEATLVKDLPRMVAYLSKKGIPCSLTTNGTADRSLYRRLVENGLREIRISCDSHSPKDFDRLVHRAGAYEKVIAGVQELVRMRDQENHSIHIILNLCVGQQNMNQLPLLVQQSLALQPDDVKLIGISHERTDLAAFEHRQRSMATIRNMLASFPNKSFPLLHMKVNTVFESDTYGLKDPTSKRVVKHCLIPLTERVFDGQFYYPCSTYLREGGQPLGRLDEDSFQVQQEKSFRFAKGESCPEDPICREFCIHCCKKFNIHANAVYNQNAKDLDGKWAPLTAQFEYTGEITDAEVLVEMNAIEQQRSGFSYDLPYRPFLVLKPSGLPYRGKILTHLKSEGFHIEKSVAIQNWNALATRLYSVPLGEKKVFRGLLLERVLPEVEQTAAAELWFLRGDPTIADLNAIKKRIRASLPPQQCLVLYKEEIMLTSLSYLHSPSENNYAIEANVLFNQL